MKIVETELDAPPQSNSLERETKMVWDRVLIGIFVADIAVVALFFSMLFWLRVL